MYDVTVAIRNRMINESNIVNLISDRIYPSHISTITNPIFPLITMSRISGGTNAAHTATDIIQQIDVWSKDGYDELWKIYSEINKLINLQIFDCIIFCKETNVSDDLYEEDTQTYHLSARYRIIAK